MLDHYFRTPWVRERLRSSCVGPYLDGFSVALADAGCSHKTIVTYVRFSSHLGHWADARRIHITSWDDGVIPRFRRHLARCTCRQGHKGVFRSARAALKQLLTYLRERGAVAGPSSGGCARTAPAIVKRFSAWMVRHRGLTASTLSTYEVSLRPFIAAFGEDLGALDATTVRDFVVAQIGRRGREGAYRLAIAVRSFLRFAVADGLLRAGIEHCIPSVPRYRLSSLPRYISASDVDRVIRGCHLSTAHGRRDHAVLLLLARLGLRAGDIVAMKLTDIDWRRGTLRVRGKGQRETLLPLPQDAGDALLGYLEHGRPASHHEHVFLTVAAPARPFGTSMTVSGIVRVAFERAGIRNPPSWGAHVLRHSAATAMLRAGSTLESIAAVLRHESLETTRIYAKVDVATLQQVAQPWPGGLS
jgi:integrase/recombinase XerD